MKKKTSRETYEEFINSQEAEAAISVLLSNLGYSDNIVDWIMCSLFPWFWIDNKEAILTILRNPETANEKPRIGPLISDWFHNAWKNNKYNFREKWYKWPPRFHSAIATQSRKNHHGH